MNITEQLIASDLNEDQTKLVLGFLGQYDLAAQTIMRQAQAATVLARGTEAARDVYATEQYARGLSELAQIAFMGFAIAAKEKLDRLHQPIKEQRPAGVALH